ncbi:unnamed protein product [Rotaria sordida]|uniref:Uncharacterized protein n=1 Tax=Rotaria sordida TaxID=392033 RepID=A0A818WD69_9BILA|nr:unnamed protein product [Rotaria sordida]
MIITADYEDNLRSKSALDSVSTIVPLSSYVTIEKHYLLPIISGDDQHIPLYTGCKPVQLEFGTHSIYCNLTDSATLYIPQSLESAGNSQIKSIINQYKQFNITTIELWPTLGAYGFYTWVYARAFINYTHWIWFNSSEIILESSVNSPLNSSQFPEPYFPKLLMTSNPEDNFQIFSDMLQFPILTDKPVFGDCLWTSNNYTSSLDEKQTTTIYQGWLPVEQMNAFQHEQRHNICVLLPQPARNNGKSYTLFVNITEENEIIWPSNIVWYIIPSPSSDEINQTMLMSNDWYKNLYWPTTFARDWTFDMHQFSGKQPLEYENKTKLYLTRKSSIQSNNQLLDLIDYLIERYQKMDIRTEKQYFQWRNITQANLIAFIPAGKAQCNEPVLFIDHIDTAFEKDTFYNTGQRRTTQGADDNVSGLVALLQSVSILKETQKTACRDIWLVHMTGEEYPAASLGIVYFLQQLLVKKQPIYTAVIVDMISHRVNRTDPIIQINPSDSTKSMLLAQLALTYVYPNIKNNLILENLQPVIRKWSDPYSYLYNTDGVRFVEYGFECILFNEHINYNENYRRSGYHDTLDTIALIDFEYGQTVSQYAIATVAILDSLKFYNNNENIQNHILPCKVTPTQDDINNRNDQLIKYVNPNTTRTISIDLYSLSRLQTTFTNHLTSNDSSLTVDDMKASSKKCKRKRNELFSWRKICCSLPCTISLATFSALALATIAVGIYTAIIGQTRTSVVASTTTSTVTSTTTVTTTSTTTTVITFCWNSTGKTVAGITLSPGLTPHQLSLPFGVKVDSSNTIYIADRYNNRVQKWLMDAPNGTTAAGQSNGATGIGLNYLMEPANIEVAPNGDIYVVERLNNRVVKWTSDASNGTLIAGTGAVNDQFNEPHGIASDWSSGTIYVSDYANHRVVQYLLSNTTSGKVVAGGNGAGTAINQLYFPVGIYFDSSSNSLFIANIGSHTIVRWVIGASNWTLVVGVTGSAGITSTQLNSPGDVTFDWMGNMYVADVNNDRIQFFQAGQSNGTTIAGVTLVPGSNSNLLSDLYAFANESVGSPIVSTTSGQFSGFTIRQTNVWIGIPYAAPPIGILRWQKAQPYVITDINNSTIQNATHYSPSCPQIERVGITSGLFDEDCLYLNIWAPRASPSNSSRGYPVMLWIHGGGLQEGSSTQIIYDGLSWTNAAIQENNSFIIVSINYRLNVMGFFVQSALTDANGQAIANQGITDQRMAMKWIQDNIGQFGGDKNSITLAGQSGGSYSVCIHIVSPLSAGLFHAGIMESGSCDIPFYMYDKQFAYSVTNDLASRVGCNMTSSTQQLACLRNINSTQLITTMLNVSIPLSTSLIFKDQLKVIQVYPFNFIVDGVEIPTHPLQLFLTGTFNRVPTLLGVTHDEFVLRVLYEEYVYPPNSTEDYLTRILPIMTYNQSEIEALYNPNLFNGNYSKAFVALMSQGAFICGARRMAGYMANQPTYLYTYNHAPESFWLSLPSLIIWPGAYHSTELLNLFQTASPLLYGDQMFLPNELSLVTSTRRYWTNMITKHQPNNNISLTWPPYSPTKDQTLVLDINITTAAFINVYPNCDVLSAAQVKLFGEYIGLDSKSLPRFQCNLFILFLPYILLLFFTI